MSVISNGGLVLTTILASILGVSGCGAPATDGHGGRSAQAGGSGAEAPKRALPEPTPWTDAFQTSAVLLAGSVRIEVPRGQFAHVATVVDSEELDRSEKTVPEGYLTVISVKPEAHGAQIKAQLDRLVIVALERLSVLERPGATSVLVDAKGQVYWENSESGEKKHVETLHLEGKIGR